MAPNDPNREQVEGRIEEATGEIKQTVGEATGNRELAREGAREEAAGEVKEAAGDLEAARDDATPDIHKVVEERYEKKEEQK